MDLREAGIREERALFVGAVCCGHVATARVCRKEEDVAVAAGREHDRIGGVRVDRTGDQVARDDSFRVTVHDDEIEHLGVRIHLHRVRFDLPAERLIRA